MRDDVVKKRVKSQQDIVALANKYILESRAVFDDNAISVSLVSSADSISYNVDPGDIKAILNNLCSNSVKSLKKVDDRTREIILSVHKTDRFIIIKCTDNGIGIREEDRERIFDPFQSTTEGFGIGLTIVDEITKEYGGALELIETEIGACFAVKLRC